MQNHDAAGFTLVELITAIAIILLLTTMALPVARTEVKEQKEVELRRDLREMRNAIDRYKDFSDQGLIPPSLEGFGYPPSLQALVNGVKIKGTDVRYKFLRRIPRDPMTGHRDWGLRCMQDSPNSQSWCGHDVFDVYSESQGTALNGTHYDHW
jgi:general secretion pathway protein G